MKIRSTRKTSIIWWRDNTPYKCVFEVHDNHHTARVTMCCSVTTTQCARSGACCWKEFMCCGESVVKSCNPHCSSLKRSHRWVQAAPEQKVNSMRWKTCFCHELMFPQKTSQVLQLLEHFSSEIKCSQLVCLASTSLQCWYLHWVHRYSSWH